MENRYSLFASKNVRDIKGYNEELDKEGSTEKLPQIVICLLYTSCRSSKINLAIVLRRKGKSNNYKDIK